MLREDIGDTLEASIVFAEREYIDAKVRVFIDRALPALKALLEGDSVLVGAAAKRGLGASDGLKIPD